MRLRAFVVAVVVEAPFEFLLIILIIIIILIAARTQFR